MYARLWLAVFTLPKLTRVVPLSAMASLLEVEEDKKGVPVSFGTTQNRKLFPHHCAFNRLGNTDGVRGETHLGPDKYNVDNVSSAVQLLVSYCAPVP